MKKLLAVALLVSLGGVGSSAFGSQFPGQPPSGEQGQQYKKMLELMKKIKEQQSTIGQQRLLIIRATNLPPSVENRKTLTQQQRTWMRAVKELQKLQKQYQGFPILQRRNKKYSKWF